MIRYIDLEKSDQDRLREMVGEMIYDEVFGRVVMRTADIFAAAMRDLAKDNPLLVRNLAEAYGEALYREYPHINISGYIEACLGLPREGLDVLDS